MGLVTFGLNVTLDGCYDHREMIALHDYRPRRAPHRDRRRAHGGSAGQPGGQVG
jgi:hypothetical protein